MTSSILGNDDNSRAFLTYIVDSMIKRETAILNICNVSSKKVGTGRIIKKTIPTIINDTIIS
jgi:hypothetical protein